MAKNGSLDGWLAGLGGPKHWRAEDGRRALSAWKSSGLSMEAFAQRHGFNGDRLAWWRDRLGASATTAMTLVPMTVREVVVSPRTTGAPVSLVIDGGVRVEVADPACVSPAWFAAVAIALSRRNA